jgi:hypothetical protein
VRVTRSWDLVGQALGLPDQSRAALQAMNGCSRTRLLRRWLLALSSAALAADGDVGKRLLESVGMLPQNGSAATCRTQSSRDQGLFRARCGPGEFLAPNGAVDLVLVPGAVAAGADAQAEAVGAGGLDAAFAGEGDGLAGGDGSIWVGGPCGGL